MKCSGEISAFGFLYDLNLFSDLTYFLTGPNQGDQSDHRGRRWVVGLDAHHTIFGELFGRKMEKTPGLPVRNDWIHNGLYQSVNRLPVDKVHSSTGNILRATTQADRINNTQSAVPGRGVVELNPCPPVPGDSEHGEIEDNEDEPKEVLLARNCLFTQSPILYP